MDMDLASGPASAQAAFRWRAHDPDWRGYAIGYRRAAEELTERVTADGVHLDTLAFPIGGLFRHALELHLKWLAVVLREELRESVRLIGTHDIERLWRHLERPIRSLGLDGEGWKRIDNHVGLISRIDPRGLSFRYPVGIDGTSLLAPDALNLASLADAAHEVLDALEAMVACAMHEGRLRAEEAMHEAAQEWWHSLGDEEQARYEEEDLLLHEAYMAGHIP